MCTNFSLFSTSANSDYSISARTVDFHSDLKTELIVVPQGQSFPQYSPPNNPLTWKNKYGYVAMQSKVLAKSARSLTPYLKNWCEMNRP